jgi:hypothetical protein
MKNHLLIASMCITLTSIMRAESFDSFEQALVAPEKATTLDREVTKMTLARAAELEKRLMKGK